MKTFYAEIERAIGPASTWRLERGWTDRRSEFLADQASRHSEPDVVLVTLVETHLARIRTEASFRWTAVRDSGRGVRELQGRCPLGSDWGRSALGRRTVIQSPQQGPYGRPAGAAMRGMAREYAAGNASRTGVARVCGDVGSSLQAQPLRLGSGMARSRAKARVELGFPKLQSPL